MTDENIDEVIDAVKQSYIEGIKLPMAPWVKTHQVSIDDLYTDVSLQQTVNTPIGEDTVPLESYQNLFVEKETVDEQQQIDPKKKNSRKKILAKGEAGTGKSSLSKKIAYDWAKGVFTAVSVVFLVSLKLIRPGETIENIIIQQHARLRACKVTEKKLNFLIESFGNRCVIILDGFDENIINRNSDILEFIQGGKLLYCNIVMTSRPHCTKNVENSFNFFVTIQGFSATSAEQFVSKCLNEDEKIRAVLKLNNESFTSPSSHSNPMLLLFISILVKFNALDLTKRVVPIGEIFTRIVRSVYRKYCTEKGDKSFDNNQWGEILERLGKVAWKMAHNEALVRESDIIRTVGEDAFETGLLVGHRDFRCSANETADIIVTFIHDAIREFFGAFYFIAMLNSGEDIDSLLSIGSRKDVLIINRLFLQFCLWFLSDDCWDTYFTIPNRKGVYDSLVMHTANKLDLVQLDLEIMGTLFPVMNVYDNQMRGQRPILTFLHDSIRICHKIKELYLDFHCSYSVRNIAELMNCIPPNVSVFGSREVQEILINKVTDTDNVKYMTIFEKVSKQAKVAEMVKCYKQNGKLLCLSLLVDRNEIELSDFMHESLKSLSLVRKSDANVTGRKIIMFCPILADLSLINLNVSGEALDVLTSAVRNRKLPSLTRLSFKGANTSITGKVSQLFQCGWPKLRCLDLDECILDESDMKALSYARRNQNLKLTSLTLYLGHQVDRQRKRLDLFQLGLGNSTTGDYCERWQRPSDLLCQILFPEAHTKRDIKILVVHEINIEEVQRISTAVNSGRLPHLTNLSISVQRYFALNEQKNLQEKATPIVCPHLTDLTLQGFVCSPLNLLTVAVSAKRSAVRYLDISHSCQISGKLFILVGHSFPKLHTLNLKDCGLNSKDLCSLAKASCRNRLPELKHLDLSDNPGIVCHLRCFFSCAQNWRNLNLLAVESPKITDNNQDLATAVRSGALENVQTLITKTESDMNTSAVTSVKWLSLQRLVLTCCSAYTSDRCVTILQGILEAKDKAMLPNLDELFIIRGMLSVDPLKPSNWVNVLAPISHGQFMSSFLPDLNLRTNKIRRDEIKNICYTFTRNLFNKDWFESVYKIAYEKLESKLQLLCPEDYQSQILAATVDIFREIVPHVQISTESLSEILQILQSVWDIIVPRDKPENLISHLCTCCAKIIDTDEEDDGFLSEFVRETFESFDWSSYKDVSVFRGKFLQLCRIKYELGKVGIRFHILTPKSFLRIGEIALDIKGNT